MKQLFTIFLMIQLWAAPAYAALSECVDHLPSDTVSSTQMDMGLHANHAMAGVTEAFQSEATCEHCEDKLASDETVPSRLATDEVCASIDVTGDDGLTQSRDQKAILPLVNPSGFDLFETKVRRTEPTYQSLERNKIYLRTSRIRI